MNQPVAAAVFLGWLVAVPLLFRFLGVRRGLLVAAFGGFLFLPRSQVHFQGWTGPPPIDKRTVTGLAMLIGALIMRRRGLPQRKFDWADLPMIVFVLISPLAAFTSDFGSFRDALDQICARALGWLVPYWLARRYLGDDEGIRRIATAVVIGGLVYVPFCGFESVMGPPWYLSRLLFGLQPIDYMVDRLGGWRPEVFLNDGLEVALWMAATAVLATWLAIGGGWRVRWLPIWLVTPILVAASIACRGVYGYLVLAVGLVAAIATRFLRTRAILIALMIAGPLYIGLRASGIWDGRLLVAGAAVTGRPGTVSARIDAEDRYLAKLSASDVLVFGTGVYVWHREAPPYPDGFWIQTLYFGGFIGLAAQMLALYLVPAGLALARPQRRPTAREAGATAWGLALVLLLQMLDNLHNISTITPIALMIGAIVGRHVARTDGQSQQKRAAGKTRGGSPRPVASRWFQKHAALAVLVLILVLIEVAGFLTRSRLTAAPSAEPDSLESFSEPAIPPNPPLSPPVNRSLPLP